MAIDWEDQKARMEAALAELNTMVDDFTVRHPNFHADVMPFYRPPNILVWAYFSGDHRSVKGYDLAADPKTGENGREYAIGEPQSIIPDLEAFGVELGKIVAKHTLICNVSRDGGKRKYHMWPKPR